MEMPNKIGEMYKSSAVEMAVAKHLMTASASVAISTFIRFDFETRLTFVDSSDRKPDEDVAYDDHDGAPISVTGEETRLTGLNKSGHNVD
jgi:hypothetical protein